jgi:RimJ/RimL family protein N-acetyltransferase
VNRPLFKGVRVQLAAPDPERDAEVLSRWTHDPTYLQLTGAEPARPSTPGEIREKIETTRMKMGRNQFEFMILTQDGDRPIGFIRLFAILWPHGVARVQLAIGDPADRRQGYGREALQLILRYAFDELNLYRLAAVTTGDNQAALCQLQDVGFSREVCQREAISLGRGWQDLIHLALLRPEWIGTRTGGTST